MTLLLIVIYLAFISLGLPDSLLGSAWPAMYPDIDVDLSAAGVISFLVCGCTVISSLLSNRIIHRFKTGKVMIISVTLTAIALFGISTASSLLWVCIWAIPLGLGGGSVDAALNNFVALHYKAKHMNWLHCFWGVGATAGPMVMSMMLLSESGWRKGYSTISIFQVGLILVLIASLPLWRKYDGSKEKHNEAKTVVTNSQAIRLPGVKYALLAFLCYCGVEYTVGVWAGSYLVENRGLTVATAAFWVSLYFGGITVGRGISGFLAIKVRTVTLMRLGCGICLVGVALLLLPLPPMVALIGLILLGLGEAPFFPSMIHETPKRFGAVNSQAAIGLQMASSYIGSTFVPLAIGFLSIALTLSIMPLAALIFIVGMFAFNELTIKTTTGNIAQLLNRHIPKSS